MVYFFAHYNHQNNNKAIHKKLKYSSLFPNRKYIRKSKPYHYDYNGIYYLKYCKHFFLFFHHLLGLFHYTILDISGSLLIANEVEGKASCSSGHGAKVGVVKIEVTHGKLSLNQLLSVSKGGHTQNLSSTLIQISHNISGKSIRNGYIQVCNRL